MLRCDRFWHEKTVNIQLTREHLNTVITVLRVMAIEKPQHTDRLREIAELILNQRGEIK